MITMRRMKWFVPYRDGFALPVLDSLDKRKANLVIGINYRAPGNGGGLEWTV